MIQKPYRLDLKDIEIIQEVRMRQGLRSEAEALRYIIRSYGSEMRKEDGRVTTVLQELEKKQDLVLDAINTILIENGIEVCQPISLRESQVLVKSREYRKARLAHLKVNKDYQNKKRGDKSVP